MSEDANIVSETSPVNPAADAPATSEIVTGESSSLPPEELEAFGKELIAAIKTVYDPEIPVDVWELGLIYDIDINEADGSVVVEMSLTAPGCPVAGEMPGMVADALVTVPGFGEIEVGLTFEPAWTAERMSDEARVALDWF